MRDRAGLACCVAVLLLAPGAARGQEAVPPDLSFAAADRDGDGAVDEGELGLDLADAFLGLDRDGNLVLTRAEAGAAGGGRGRGATRRGAAGRRRGRAGGGT